GRAHRHVEQQLEVSGDDHHDVVLDIDDGGTDDDHHRAADHDHRGADHDHDGGDDVRVEHHRHGAVTTLRSRWLALCRPYDAAVAAEAFADLAARYAEPQRAYHTLEHIEAVLDTLDRV